MDQHLDSIQPIEKIAFGSNEYREYFRNNYITGKAKTQFLGISNGKVYLTIVFIIAISAPIIMASRITEFRYNYLILFPFYFILCNLFEYVLHRFPMHRKIKGLEFLFEHVTIHHNFFTQKFNFYKQPKDYMAAILPLLYFVFISIAFFILAIFIYLISDLNNALFFESVIYCYYFMYEVLHFSYHSPNGSFLKKVPFIKNLSKFHLQHHRTDLMAKNNFNITIPLFDIIFDTLHEKNTNRIDQTNENY
jgi:hypothetical protein